MILELLLKSNTRTVTILQSMIVVSRSVEISPIPLILAHMGFLIMMVAVSVLICYILVN